MKKTSPVVLAILDGWGIGKPGPANAISLAHTPNMTSWSKKYPNSQLIAYGPEVGLSGTTTGNSEVGHINIGAGYVVLQDEVKINQAISNQTFFENTTLLQACNHVKSNQSSLHLIALVGPGQVHSNIDHLWATLKLARQQKITSVFVHVISDGRDASPSWMGKNAEAVQHKIMSLGGQVVSLCGRYFALDRDGRWDRIEKMYRLLLERKGVKSADLTTAVQRNYQQQKTDEFIEPTIIGNGQPIQDNDAVIFLNFRSDRARQLTSAIVCPDFSHFARPNWSASVAFYTMTEYQADLPVAGIAFPPSYIKQPLAKVLSEAGLNQLHIAESEKYAHVTYFLNGGQEVPFVNEDRVLIDSPKVATYDLKPEMSAKKVADGVVQAIKDNKHQFIVVNFANPDMVAHTGNLAATIKAVETVDSCLGEIQHHLEKQNGTLFVTADHGNAEVLIDKSGEMDTQHNSGVVPFIVVGKELPGEIKNGALASVAPTILEFMGIPIPSEMTAPSLWAKHSIRST